MSRHFVADAAEAAAALARAGFAPTPVSIQVEPDPGGRSSRSRPAPATSPRCSTAAISRCCSRPRTRRSAASSMPPCSAIAGVHLVAFAVADAAATHARLALSGFRVQPLVAMQRPVATVDRRRHRRILDRAARARRDAGGPHPGADASHRAHGLAAALARRIRTAPRRSLDVLIAEADPHEAASRFERFLDRSAVATPFGPGLQLDRGRVQLCDAAALTRLLPGIAVPAFPFIAAYGVLVASLDRLMASLRAGGLAFERRSESVVAPFPDALGVGCWVFAEAASAFPWRSDA